MDVRASMGFSGDGFVAGPENISGSVASASSSAVTTLNSLTPAGRTTGSRRWHKDKGWLQPMSVRGIFHR